MSRLFGSLLVALALASAFASDQMTDKQKADIMEKMQNMHLYRDSFLGDHVIGFRDLNDADRAKKLQELVKDIDTDKDGLVSVDELKAHLHRIAKLYRVREVEEMLNDQDDNKDGKISMEEFTKHTFGGEQDETQKELVAEDGKKFAHADQNGDKMLNLQEYIAFNHPIDDKRMTQYAIDEHLKKHDTDKDGVISLDEFMASFTDQADDSMKEEFKKDFEENYDQDKNGKLTREEIEKWAVPEDSFINDEPPRILKDADEDKDGKLSTAEIIKHLDIFLDKPLKEVEGETEQSFSPMQGGENADSEKKHDEL